MIVQLVGPDLCAWRYESAFHGMCTVEFRKKKQQVHKERS